MSKPKILAAAWTVMLVVGCWIPSNRLAVDETATSLLRVPNLDKIAHLVMFGIFAFLWTRAYRVARSRFAFVLSAAIALAIITELGQGTRWVRRDADLLDAVADILGAAIGIGACLWFEKRSATKKP